MLETAEFGEFSQNFNFEKFVGIGFQEILILIYLDKRFQNFVMTL